MRPDGQRPSSTSQIAQINTRQRHRPRSNTSVQSLSTQCSCRCRRCRARRWSAKTWSCPATSSDIANGTGQGGFELTSAADAVKVEVMSPAGPCSTR